MSDGDVELTGRPWSARRPQNIALSVVFIALAVALVWQAMAYIGQGVGGVVPYLMMIGGPGLAAYYIWFFNFRDFEADAQAASN